MPAAAKLQWIKHDVSLTYSWFLYRQSHEAHGRQLESHSGSSAECKCPAQTSDTQPHRLT